MKKRNKIALDLFSKKYRKRVVKAKKGKGSFKRKKIQLSLAPIIWMTFDAISVPFSKLSFILFLFMYPCKNPAAKRSPAPVKSMIFKFSKK